jgi:PAS domain S-box-containing protein
MLLERREAQGLAAIFRCMIVLFNDGALPAMVLPFDRFVRRLVLIWILSLIGIAGLAVISGFLFDDAVSQTETYTEVISLAGRQRTLSQQVALFASQYVNAGTDARRAPFGRQLRGAVDTMRLEFAQLEAYTASMPHLNALYYDGESPVASVNRTYWDAADTLLAVPEDQLSVETPSYISIAETAPSILNDADLGVQAVQDSSVESSTRLRRINDIRLVFIVAVLAGQLIFAFRPAIRRMQRKAELLQQEIIDRLQAESDLRVSEQRFRMVLETAPVGIFLADLHGVITWVNPQWESLTGLNGDVASTMSWTDAIHPDDRPTVVSQIKRNAAEGSGFSVDFRLARKSRVPTTINVTVRPLKASDGVVTGYIGMLIDITERKKAHDQELRLESERQRVRILGQFIRDTSHDLRTPLSVIKSGLYLVSRSTDLDRIREKVGVIDQHVNYLTIVIEQLHEMAVLDTLTELTLMPMYVTPLLRDVMNDLALQADASGKAARFEFEADLPPTLIAPEKLLQAVRAVITNALDYTEPGGSIVFKAAQSGSYVEIVVCDDGVGIAAEHLPHVFDRFYKADKARAMGGGAGLGLSIAKRVIELHGGQISLESQPGMGTTVRMTLIIAGNRLADLIGR